MTTASPTWLERSQRAIRDLAARPVRLFTLLLALNALARPYGHFNHDARLYAAQVLNQIEAGAYSDDLFFRYGSQDQYSIFSRCMAPIASVIGLDAAFLAVFLICNGLLIFALVRFVEALVHDRLLSTLALAFMVSAPLTFGGLKTLHVLEPFLTPRLPANVLVLFALERVVRGRFAMALGLLLLALAFHPLMAVSGLFVWAGCFIWVRLPKWSTLFVGGAALAAAVGILATPLLGTRLFGTMDDGWRDVIRHATAFNFLTEWQATDWLNALVGLGVVLWAGLAPLSPRLFHQDVCSDVSGGGRGVGGEGGSPKPVTATLTPDPSPSANDFLARTTSLQVEGEGGKSETALSIEPASNTSSVVLCAIGLVGLAGLVGNWLAEYLPYAFLFQGQPYRALWLVKVAEIPLGLWLARRWWRTEHWAGPLAAALLVGCMSLTTGMALEIVLPLFFLPLLVLGFRGLDAKPRQADFWPRALAWSVVCGGFAWTAYRLALVLGHSPLLLERLDSLEFVRIVIQGIGPAIWLTVFVLAAIAVSAGRLRWTPLAIAVAAPLFMFQVPALPYYRVHHSRHDGDLRFVREFLAERRGQELPTLYSALGRLDYVWIDLEAKSYFDWWQVSGVMFQRTMALEGQRRALLVAPFEVERLREAAVVPEVVRAQASRFFQIDFDTAQPSGHDLSRLCRENVDFLVLRQEFPGLSVAGNGRIFIYDCRQLRAHLDRSPDSTLASHKTTITKDFPP